MQLDKQRTAALTEKLAAIDCAAHFEDTTLLYPETEAWSAVIQNLSDKLRCGVSLDKLVKMESGVDVPSTPLARTQQLLTALCIEATEQQILGAGSIEERTDFLEHLTDLAVRVCERLRGERLKDAAAKDALLLASGCRAVADLSVNDIQLFKRFPELHALVQSARDAQPQGDESLRQKLEDAQAALRHTEAVLDSIPHEEIGIDSEELRAAQSALDHSLGAFVAGAAEFNAIYTKSLEPWTASVCPPTLHGIGPLAKDIDLRYSRFREVLGACGMLKASYGQLLQSHESSAGEASFAPHILADGPVLAKDLQARTAMLVAMSSAGTPSAVLSTAGL